MFFCHVCEEETERNSSIVFNARATRDCMRRKAGKSCSRGRGIIREREGQGVDSPTVKRDHHWCVKIRARTVKKVPGRGAITLFQCSLMPMLTLRTIRKARSVMAAAWKRQRERRKRRRTILWSLEMFEIENETAKEIDRDGCASLCPVICALNYFASPLAGSCSSQGPFHPSFA